jgi:uridine kinase
MEDREPRLEGRADPPVIIGVAGGSASGKTTVVEAILERVGYDEIVIIPHDAYYRDMSHLPFERRKELNFDHPDALETELLLEHLEALRRGEAVDIPVYDFTHHWRLEETRRVEPEPVVVVEGILVLAEPDLRDMMDVRIYVDTDPDLRFIRRLQRDINERGRTRQSVINQYLETVRPMHLEFVEPSKRYADIIIPEGGFNEVALDLIAARVEALMRGAGSADSTR